MPTLLMSPLATDCCMEAVSVAFTILRKNVVAQKFRKTDTFNTNLPDEKLQPCPKVLGKSFEAEAVDYSMVLEQAEGEFDKKFRSASFIIMRVNVFMEALSVSFTILRKNVFMQFLVASATPQTCLLARGPAPQLTVAAASQQGDRAAARRLRRRSRKAELARSEVPPPLQRELLIATTLRTLLVCHGPSRPVATSGRAQHRRTRQLQRSAEGPSRSALLGASADVSPCIRAEGPRMGGVSETSQR